VEVVALVEVGPYPVDESASGPESLGLILGNVWVAVALWRPDKGHLWMGQLRRPSDLCRNRMHLERVQPPVDRGHPTAAQDQNGPPPRLLVVVGGKPRAARGAVLVVGAVSVPVAVGRWAPR